MENTAINYEKKYNDMVQRAKELHESGNALTKQQMEIVCPELRESEDERIRKWIVNLLHELHYNQTAQPMALKAIEWLEKQKEPERSDIDREMLDRIIERGRCELPPHTRALTSDMIQWLQWMNEGRIEPKQKEQKVPEQCLKCNEYEIGYKAGYEHGNTAGYNRAVKEAREQNPAEWSEEDENNIGWIVSFLQGEEGSGEVIDLMKESLISWLKSLRPMKDCSGCSKHLEGYISGRTDAENKLLADYGILIMPDHELRMKPHWKPSEEQMIALNGCLEHWSENKSQKEILESLYEQLKSL